MKDLPQGPSLTPAVAPASADSPRPGRARLGLIVCAVFAVADLIVLNGFVLPRVIESPKAAPTAPTTSNSTTLYRPSGSPISPPDRRAIGTQASMPPPEERQAPSRAPTPIPAPAPAPAPILAPIPSVRVQFDMGSSELRAESQTALTAVLVQLQATPTASLHILGHTDDVGTSEFNDRLSVRRAEVVRDWLVKRGIMPDRISVEGLGARQPIAKGIRWQTKAENRRVEFVWK